MEKIKWQDSWLVGVSKIDKQHQGFVTMFNTFIVAYDEGEEHEILYSTLKEMLDYLKNHFAEEETWMEKVDYADFGPHLKEHRSFVEKTNEFVTRYFEGDDEIADEMCEFLSAWFVNHVTGTDMKYAPAFKEWIANHPEEKF